MSRPSAYTPEIAEQICERLSAGESLRDICADESMPARRTVHGWVESDRDGFSHQYARARDAGCDAIAEDLLDIADDGSNDWMVRNDAENHGYMVNGECVQRSKLRVDARKWLLSKFAPKKYGDHTKVEMSGSLATRDLTNEEIQTQIAELVASGHLPRDLENVPVVPDDGSDIC